VKFDHETPNVPAPYQGRHRRALLPVRAAWRLITGRRATSDRGAEAAGQSDPARQSDAARPAAPSPPDAGTADVPTSWVEDRLDVAAWLLAGSYPRA